MAEENVKTQEAEKTADKQNRAESSQVNEKGFELREMTFSYLAEAYQYAANLRARGHAPLADRLISQALDIEYASAFANHALSSDAFMNHLKTAYYASGKSLEILKFVMAVKIKCEGHDLLVDKVNAIHRMYGASISTVQKKQAERQAKETRELADYKDPDPNVGVTEPTVPKEIGSILHDMEEDLQNNSQKNKSDGGENDR